MAERQQRKEPQRNQRRDVGTAVHQDDTMPERRVDPNDADTFRAGRVGQETEIVRGPNDEGGNPGDESSPMSDSDAK